MGKLVQVGRPVNDAEKWAFEFLKSELPDHYIIISNVDVYTDHGQPFECDAIVVGDWAIYIVDIKGYQGRLNAGKDVWQHNNRTVENPLPKLHHNARVLASRCRTRLRQNQHAPWCQGLAFITGGLGGDIVVAKGEDNLPVYNGNNIVKALTTPDYVTAFRKHKVDQSQKEIALSAICDFKLLKDKEQKVGNYAKKRKLSQKGSIELWIVEPEGHTFSFEYWMKYVDITGLDESLISEMRGQLKREFYVLSELADLPSVPAALSYHDDGESIALVHQNVIGQPLSQTANYNKKEIVIEVAQALIDVSKKGIYHWAMSLDNIYVSAEGRVQLLDVGLPRPRNIDSGSYDSQVNSSWLPPEFIENGTYDASSLSYQFAHVFLPILSNRPPASDTTQSFLSEGYVLDKGSLDSPFGEAFEWFSRASSMDAENRPHLNELIECFSSDVTTTSVIQNVLFEPGARINEKYELLNCIGRGGTSSIWRAKHLIGEYDCCLKILDSFDGADQLAKKEFEILRILYHPNIVRIFDLDIVPGNDNYFLTCEYLDGSTLEQLEVVTEDDILRYFEQMLSALQYLHRMGRMHKDVKPENIMIVSGKAYLIDFNISLVESKLLGTTKYKDPLVKSEGWHFGADIYSLVLTFAELITGVHPFLANDELPSTEGNPVIPTAAGLSDTLRVKFEQTLRHEVNWNAIDDYLAWFKLSRKADVDIPEDIINQWNIKKGYMSKVLTTMLGDMQPRSREVIKRNTLKAYGIVGNKSNKGSVNAAISSLKSRGIIEEHGKKIRFTNQFLLDWETSKSR